MHVLLVVPRYSNHWGETYQFPLGLGYIASAMKDGGHIVSVINLNHIRGSIQNIIRHEVLKINPHVCATGTLSPFLNAVQDIFSASRQAKKDIINIAGGGVVSGEPGVILDAADIDVGVVNEGEETITKLLHYIDKNDDLHDLHHIQGIVFRDMNGKIVQTMPRPQIKDLGSLAWPDYEALQVKSNIQNQRALDNYFFQMHPTSQPRSIDMITSRSCPFKCTFCFHPTGKTYRERPLDDFFAELDFLIEQYNVNMVMITDELFSLKRSRLLEFCERIKPYNIQWLVQLHVRSVTEPVIQALRESGCASISYGIESMSQTILKSMKKRSKIEEIEYALDLTYKNNIDIQGNLLFGDSSETLETANESMHWWSKNRRYQINLTPLMVFPGSPDYLNALRNGLIKDSDRLDFVENIPARFNISKIDDKTMNMLRFGVRVFFRTLLNIAPVTSFEISQSQISGRDTAYDIQWGCPCCCHHNDYHSVILPSDAGDTIRLACRRCRSRWDIQNRMFRPKITNIIDDEECTVVLNEAESLFKAGFYKKSYDAANQLIKDAPNFSPAQLFMGRLHREQGSADKMLRSYGFALFIDKLNPKLHNEFADRLCELGAYGAARLHYEQSLKLETKNKHANAKISFIDGSDINDRQRSTYFVSWAGYQL